VCEFSEQRGTITAVGTSVHARQYARVELRQPLKDLTSVRSVRKIVHLCSHAFTGLENVIRQRLVLTAALGEQIASPPPWVNRSQQNKVWVICSNKKPFSQP
jgi:hypothetical protein